MGTQMVLCSEVFTGKVCVSILIDPATNVNGSLEAHEAGLTIFRGLPN